MLSKESLLKFLWLVFVAVGIFIFPIKHYLNILLGLQYPIDFAIYHKAIIEIGSFNSFNPYLALRDIQIFADHFDPILILPALFSGLFNFSSLYSLLIEGLFVFLLFDLIFIDFKKEKLLDFSLVFSLVFFNRSLFSGLDYPIHPTLWSLPFLYLAIKELSNDRVIFSTGINFFKEVFCLFLLPAGVVGYFLEKKKKWLKVIGIQVCFILIIFVIRPLIWKTYSYGVNPLEGLKSFNYLDLLKMTLPSLVLIALMRKKLSLNKVLIFLAFYLPSVGLHILSGKSYYHYGTFLSYPLIIFTILSFKDHKDFIPKKAKIFIIILGIGIAFNGLKKGIKSLTSNIHAYNHNQEHRDLLNKLKMNHINKVPSNSKILASPGLLTFALTPGKRFYQFGEYSKIEESVDYLLLDFRSYGQNFGISKEQLSQVLNQCQPHVTQTLFKERDLYFLKGPFPKSCWFVNKSFWRSYKGENK